MSVSTHAPTRGATTSANRGTSWTERFNPRAHAPTRGATGQRAGRPHQHAVSTHAPTRGATTDHCHSPHDHAVSTHAPTRGATSNSTSGAMAKAAFQPTRPRGARRGGGDVGLDLDLVSTHAPTRGATAAVWSSTSPIWMFQPTRLHPKYQDHDGFNPRAHAGRDPIARAVWAGSYVSTHAPTRGATWRGWWLGCGLRSFNPRAHAGRDPISCTSGSSW